MLRERLTAFKDMLPAEARKQIAELENTHGERRNWVWAELGEAPLACILPALTALAEATVSPLGGVTPQDIATAYVAGGWKADAAVLDALRVGGSANNVLAVKHVINSLYEPWLRNGAEALQQAVKNHPFPLPPPSGKPAFPKAGCCWLFADGLRYDVGQRLGDALEQGGLTVARDWQWAALPGVTPTAKPAASPVASLLGPGPDFNAAVLEDGAKVTIDNLRRELVKTGYAILSKDETGTTTGAAWTEHGTLDATGHSQQWRLALRVPEEIKELAGRVKSLLDAGWSEVRIVTDHGWLLLPFGLPKADLPEHLTEIRKDRCARLKSTATTDQQTVPWHWDKNVLIAVPPGICCYVAGKEYDHGGLSVQECVTPVLTVRGVAPVSPPAVISSVKWTGLRCRIQVTGDSDNMIVDLRTKPADASTSITQASKPVDMVGQASVTVPDDSYEGAAAIVVLLSASGNVVAQRATVVGEND